MTGFLDQYDALATSGEPPQKILQEQFELLVQWIFGKPDELYAELRAKRPIFVMPGPGPAVVSRYRDVVEVADLGNVFSVRPYGATHAVILGGANFLLGMDDSLQYDFEVSALRLVARRTDLELIRSYVAANAKARTRAAASAGRLDITDGFARALPLQLAGQYFGVPGPDPGTLGNWIRTMFTELFFNFRQDPGVAAAGAQAGKEMRAYIEGLMAQARADRNGGAAPKDDVLGRMLTAQCDPATSLSDDRLRDNLIGLLIGMIDNTEMGVVNAMDILFNNPDKLPAAVAAAKASDPNQLLPFVMEALRFRPPAPVLERLATQDYVLAKGTDRETPIPAGKIVFAVNSSAMMDETELDAPREFREERPAYQSMVFGWGMHRCFGMYISQVQVTEIIRSLLVLDGLRRAPGDAGKLVYDGFYPKSFTVEFG
jgi:cytochrome P450